MCGIGLFSYLTYVHFLNILTGPYIVDFVNKTSHDKGRASANEERKRIPSDNTPGRNYASAG